ncbi:MAG: ABC transporter ATP-binding protein [Bacilli bacterium]
MSNVSVKNLSKSYAKKQILCTLNLDITSGEIFGLLGPSGSGKSTLIRQLIGMEIADEGGVWIDNHHMPHVPTIATIGYTAQADALYIDLTANENCLFFCELYGLHKSKWDEAILHALAIVQLEKERHTIVRKFSGGMMRRLSLALALLHQPNLLILDEPTVGMDPILRKSIWESFRRMQENGVTIFITTHVMDEAEKCDRIALLRDGACLAVGSPTELFTTHNVATMESLFLKLGSVEQ